jgi:asparagine synthetase B (glutamine-hydrolysing)
MAVLAGIVDADPQRRARFVCDAAARLDEYRDLVKLRWDHGDLTIVAAAAATTPTSSTVEADRWTWVLGDIYADEDGEPSRFLSRRVGASGPLETHGQGGYYLACTVEASGRVTLGTDVLGLFPLYYWSSAHVLVFSTLPGLAHLHPDCHARISAEGLAGILLQSFIVDGQTLWEGIHRPQPGRAVQWRPGVPARAPSANPLAPSEVHFGLEYASAIELFDATLHDAVARSTRGPSEGLMLSGGMDSRLLAGHLHELRPGATRAIVFGAPRDNEVRCARPVARALDMQVARLSPRFEDYAVVALAQLSEEHLSNTFHDLAWMTDGRSLASHCRGLVNGFLGDPIMGGSLVPHAYNDRRGVYDFDAVFANGSIWGFAPQEIASLVRALPMGDAVNSCLERMRSAYEALPGLPFQKATLWGLYHRGRFHVGAYAWRLARHVWPIMPYVDRRMLDVGLGMPLDFLGQRRMQIDILERRYAPLARLPVDRNLPDPSPLIEAWHHKARRFLRHGLNKLPTKRSERRTYYRLFDINNPGWRVVRRLADSRRASADRLFDAKTLARYLPSAEESIVVADGITHSARLKTLVGLMILSDRLVD